MFVALYRPHCFCSHDDARQRLQHSCTSLCWLFPWASEIYTLFPVHRTVPQCRIVITLLRRPRSLEVRAWEHKSKTASFCVLRGLVLTKYWVLNNLFCQRCMESSCRNTFAHCALLFLILRHPIYALIPNSWFRSFCRTRFQKKWDSHVELGDIIFA